MIPLVFLAVSSLLNIILDLWFVIGFKMGVAGAAEATVIAQYLSGLGIMLYTLVCYKRVHVIWKISCLKKERISEIVSFSMLTCIQQSVMNLGILMVQGLVNSFGTVVMAAFAAAVKIDAFAYMPVQDFGNAFSTFIAQNFGAAWIESGSVHICNLLRSNLCICIRIRKTTYDDICRCRRNTYYHGGSPLSADRRSLLYRNWMAVFAVWFVPGFGQTRNECGTYYIFPGNQGGSGIYLVSNTTDWRDRYLVVCANRMGVSGHHRVPVLQKLQKFYLIMLVKFT